MKMLKKATNRMAYAKVGLYGTAGSGKTYTAAKLAIGLHKYAKCTKPIGMFDTEPAASYIIPLFEAAGIEFLVYDESRALKDLMAFMDEAEKECSIVIVDSITHVWRDAQDSYLKQLNAKRKAQNKSQLYSLEFQHWKPIKAAWAAFTDRFLSSKLHVIVCGRAGSVYEYQDKDDGSGKKELITTGTKMATEKELGYEPSLLIEMIADRHDGKIVNVALIQKDRTDTLNGKEIAKPDFEKLKSHFEFLNLGGEHFGSMDARDSSDMYPDADESGWDAEKRTREILAEEIKSVFIEFGIDGTGNDAKTRRNATMKDVFETGSWTAIENMHSEKLRQYLPKLKEYLNDKAATWSEPK